MPTKMIQALSFDELNRGSMIARRRRGIRGRGRSRAPGGSGASKVITIDEFDFGTSPQASVDVEITGYGIVWVTFEKLGFSVITDIAYQVSTDGATFDGGASDYIRNYYNNTNGARDALSKALGGGAGSTTDHYGVTEIRNAASDSHKTQFVSHAGRESAFGGFTTLAFRDATQEDTHIRISGFAASTMNTGRVRVTGLLLG